jgi:hypothetical protein
MKKLFSALAVSFALSSGAHAALYSGDVSAGGNYSGVTTRNDAWAQENPVSGAEVNFWSFSGTAGQQITLTISSLSNDFDAAVSVYSGMLSSEFELIVPGFDNDTDFASLDFLASTTIYGTSGNDALLSFILPSTGTYTFAVGGESFLSFDDSYSYNMNVEAVPVPAAAWLFGSAVAGLVGLRRRKA